ncbi:MAG: hypothetical protein IJA52_08755 [Clostridia bacterium]|nr:hypothetical protein [Clostridia bacterium]
MKTEVKIFFLCFLCISLLLSACSCNDAEIAEPKDTSASEDQVTTAGDTDAVLPCDYDDIIKNIIKAYPWDDDYNNIVTENPELSYMYSRSRSLSDIGFALLDLDGNGQEELIVTDINSPFIYDLYTVTDGEIFHLFCSSERSCYFIYENGWIENQWSGSAATSGHDFYKLNDGSLDFVERITMDAYYALDAGLISDPSEADGENTFFRSKSEDFEDYILIPFDEAIKAIETYQNANEPLVIEYTLLSEYQK